MDIARWFMVNKILIYNTRNRILNNPKTGVFLTYLVNIVPETGVLKRLFRQFCSPISGYYSISTSLYCLVLMQLTRKLKDKYGQYENLQILHIFVNGGKGGQNHHNLNYTGAFGTLRMYIQDETFVLSQFGGFKKG